MIAELMEHTNRGTQLQLADGWVKITERYFRVRWAGAHWRAQKFWTWEPQSELIEDVPELVGEYCRRAKLVVPKEVELALAEADACAEDEAGEAAAAAAAPTGRPASQTPIPPFDLRVLLATLVAPIGDEEANGEVRRVELPAGASAAQRAAHEVTYVENTATGQREHKQTLMAREQHMDIDDKAAPGRLRYVQGSRMAIVSEDKGVGTGFWHGRIYQVHCARSAERSLPTKAGPLLLEGVLEVGYARLAEIRKGVGKASVQHPRLSVKCEDATSCEAVLIPMGLAADGTLSEDLSQPPMLVPLALLGCEVAAELLDAGDACTGAHFRKRAGRGARRHPAAWHGPDGGHVCGHRDGGGRRGGV